MSRANVLMLRQERQTVLMLMQVIQILTGSRFDITKANAQTKFYQKFPGLGKKQMPA
jgi:hypothetical protein